QAAGLFSDMSAGGGDGGDCMAPVQRFAAGEHVAASITERRVTFAQVDEAVGSLREISGGQDGLHARKLLGLGGVDAANARVGVRAAQNVAVEQPGHLEVGA